MKQWILAACSAVFLTGCATSFTPRSQGVATGNAIYLGYARVSSRQDENTKKELERLWEIINLIDSYDDLAECLDEITKAFDVCINSTTLSDQEKALCLVLKAKVTNKVAEVLANKLASNSDATEFLLGVRDGINEMAGFKF